MYRRALPVLKMEAKKILREYLEPEVFLRWMKGVKGGKIEIVEFNKKTVEKYSDENRAE